MAKGKKAGEVQNNTHQRNKSVSKKKSSETNGVHSKAKVIPSMLPQTNSESKTVDLKKERESIVLWRHPFTTLHYFVRELLLDIKEYTLKLLKYRKTTVSVLSFLVLATSLYHVEGPHQNLVQSVEKKVLWCLYWIGLGFLSSAGFGFGLHTFLLYLGPHIAKVTLAAYECGTLDFLEPPYPDDLICPDDDGGDKTAITIWAIMSKVRLEAMMWGAGTAIGELPPYFFALAKRMSGEELEDEEELEEFTKLQQKLSRHEKLSFYEKMKVTVERFVEKVGFFGILACASIPNPLFDLAGITCGLCLVPFWTFFGATLIGKAIVKTHIQQAFVIIAFSEALIETAVALVGSVPYLGDRMQEPFKEFLAKQRAKMHGGTKKVAEHKSLLGMVFEGLFIIMILYFVLSIVNSLAQSYHKRIHTKKSKRRTKNKQKV